LRVGCACVARSKEWIVLGCAGMLAQRMLGGGEIKLESGVHMVQQVVHMAQRWCT